MTRLCMDCGAELGERCCRCGSVVIAKADSTPYLECLNCKLQFSKGQGGETHGLCGVCLNARLAALHVEPAAVLTT